MGLNMGPATGRKDKEKGGAENSPPAPPCVPTEDWNGEVQSGHHRQLSHIIGSVGAAWTRLTAAGAWGAH